MSVVDTRVAAQDPPRPSGRRDEERRLHERVVAGDELALLECFDRMGDMVFCAALLLSGQRSIAEDLTEALFVDLWRAPKAFDPADGPLGLQMIRRLTDRVGSDRADDSDPPVRPGRAA